MAPLLIGAIAPASAADSSSLAPQSSTNTGMPKDRAGLDQAIHDYLMAHPELVLDALKAAQQQADAQAVEQSRRVIASKQKELLDSPDDLVQGNPTGDVTLVEFFDYRCPYRSSHRSMRSSRKTASCASSTRNSRSSAKPRSMRRMSLSPRRNRANMPSSIAR
jgi:protein-disulfide isomerase